MPLIFNWSPQSSREQGTGDTNRFLKDGGPLLLQFCLKTIHSWVGREAGLGLQDWPDEEVQNVTVRAPCRTDSLLMNEGIFLWIQDWMILEAWEGAESCCRDQGTPWKRFLAQGSRQPSTKKYRQCTARISIWIQRTQKTEGTSRSLRWPPNPWQTADFDVRWRSFSQWVTWRPKLGHSASLPPAGCQISSRPWTRGSAACHRSVSRGFPYIFGPLWPHDWP